MLIGHGMHIQEIFEQIRETLQFVARYDQISDFIAPVSLINTDHMYYVFEDGKGAVFNVKP